MYIVCGDPHLRDELVSKLQLSDAELSSKVFSSLSIVPLPGNFAVAVNDVTDGNLRHCVRYLLANAEKKLKLAIVKKRWSDAEYERVDEAIRTEYRRALEENQRVAQKLSRLPADEWKNDRMAQLREWQTIPPMNYATFTLGNEIKMALEAFLDSTIQLSINDINEVPLSSKPPVLHWTPLPLDSELQVLIRISFHLAGPDNATFTDIQRSIRKHFDDVYEWTEGVLVTDDPIHLHLERTSTTEIEIAARVCVEELEDEQQANPAKLLWNYVVLALKETLVHLNEHQYLQYTLELIPYGAAFFDSPIEARVFDLVQFMGTACEYKKVGFRFNDKVYNVHLDKLIPDGPFTSLREMLALEPPQNKSSQKIPSPNIELEHKQSFNTGLHVSHNRGRRVSFGSIKLMNESSPSVKGVDDYVEAMLKQTMEHLVL